MTPLEKLGSRRLYCDMDGVAADFEKMHEHCFGRRRERHTGWQHIAERPGFFRDMPPMADWPDLWHAIEPLKPIILTGVPSSINCASNEKIEWIMENAGRDVPVICCAARRKWIYCRPGDILIDDSSEYQHLWEAAGGVWVQHEDAPSTILQLKKMDVL